ncbi:MAG: hypothetical protein KDA28_16285, partial [Phycisphaerales bacterium]|nr:hypothetical protein [Phycisphaerales bacterium]
MRPDKLTTMAQQILADAQTDAIQRGNPEVAGLHILDALLEDRSGPGRAILARTGANADRVHSIVRTELDRLPRSEGASTQGGRELMELLAHADKEAKSRSDAYVSTEHLLLALTTVKGQAKEVLHLNAV